MATFVPDTDIYLCYVPFDNNYEDVRYFSNQTQQLTYFQSKTLKTLTDYNYQRRDGVIYVGGPVTSWLGFNYLYFRNNDYERRYIFAFITNVQYVNSDTSAIYFEVDAYQSFILACSFGDCLIERKIVAGDIIKRNIINENYNWGPPIYIAQEANPFKSGFSIALVLSEIDQGHTGVFTKPINVYNSVPCQYTIVGSGQQIPSLSGKILQEYAYYYSSRPDAIIGVIQMPNNAYPEAISTGEIKYFTEANFTLKTNTYNISFPKIDDFIGVDGTSYTPKNKKLLHYPYSYIHISLPDGQSADFYPENSSSEVLTFSVQYGFSLFPSVIVKPLNYNYRSANVNAIDTSLIYTIPQPFIFGKDFYNQYIQNNGNKVELQKMLSYMGMGIQGMQGVINTSSGNILSSAETIISGYSKLASFFAEQKDLKNHSPSLAMASDNPLINWYNIVFSKAICNQYSVELIDGYFSRYGYKVSEFGNPANECNTRESWNYVKTGNCKVYGRLPIDYARKIQQMFDNGIRMWHTDDMYNYSLSNNTKT